MVELADLPTERLEDMAAAGAEVLEVYRLLRKSGDNVVGEVLRGQGEFYEWDHFPKGDVYDPETHSQYYYHAHPAELRGGEHGHFHTFLRPKGMPSTIAPAPLADYTPPEGDNDALGHLIAISMDQYGCPIRLFSTNRWVTGEVWYAADDVIAMLDHFHMDLAYPSLPANIWITAMLRLFRPDIHELVRARDQKVAAQQQRDPDTNVYEDRDLEITSFLDISVEDQIGRINEALARKS
jgi:hypothetical protein